MELHSPAFWNVSDEMSCFCSDALFMSSPPDVQPCEVSRHHLSRIKTRFYCSLGRFSQGGYEPNNGDGLYIHLEESLIRMLPWRFYIYESRCILYTIASRFLSTMQEMICTAAASYITRIVSLSSKWISILFNMNHQIWPQVTSTSGS